MKTRRRQPSWLFTKGVGFEFGATEDKSIQFIIIYYFLLLFIIIYDNEFSDTPVCHQSTVLLRP